LKFGKDGQFFMMGMFDKNAENECQATRKDKARLVASFCAGRKRWE
jgi:hypothetical protein